MSDDKRDETSPPDPLQAASDRAGSDPRAKGVAPGSLDADAAGTVMSSQEALDAASAPLAVSSPVDFKQRKPSLVLGPSLWIGGALLWAYVVMGEWVVTIELPEALGWLVVLLVYAGTWFTTVRRPVPEQRRARHVVTPGVLGLVWFVVVVVFVSSLAGSSRRSVVAAVTVMLWFISAAMFGAGRHLSAKRHDKLEGWPRAGVAILWVATGLGTLVSLLAALERA